MGKEIKVAKKLLDDMQNNHAQWHIERTNTKKVNAVTKSNNEELTTKVDELLSALKHKNEVQINAITNAQIEEIDGVLVDAWAVEAADPTAESRKRSWGQLDENIVPTGWE